MGFDSDGAAPRLRVLAAAALFSIGGAGIKACALTNWQVSCFRSGIAALVVWLLMPEARSGWSWRAWIVGVAYAITLTTFVMANKLTTSANAIFLQYTAPLYVLLLGPWLLRERIRARDIVLMAVLMVGMVFFFVGIETPVTTAPDPFRGNFVAAVSGVAFAFLVIGFRWLSHASPRGEDSAAQGVIAGNVIAFLLALPLALPVTHARPIDWMIVAGLAVFQIGIAYVLLSGAMRNVPALEAALLLLLEPVLNPIWSWMVHGERPRLASLVGGAIILAATVVRTWYESRRAGPRNGR